MSDITLSKAVRTNLLSLQNTAEMMATTQNRLATGKKVNSALDNPTNFFTASSLNSRASDMSALLDGMANGIQTLEAADNGLEAITKTLESMQSTLRQARQDKSFETASYSLDRLDPSAGGSITLTGGAFDSAKTVDVTKTGSGQQVAGDTAAYATSTATQSTFVGSAAAATIDTTNDGKLTISYGGKSVDVEVAAGEDAATITSNINTAIGNSALNGLVSATQATGTLTLTATNQEDATIEVSDDNGGTTAGAVFGSAPATTEGQDDSWDFTINNTSISLDATTGADVDTAVETINSALAAAGEKFQAFENASGAIGIRATTSDAGPLTITGYDAGNVFGTAGDTTVASTTSSNLTLAKSVDDLVSEINNNAELEGKIAASNDDGKLRIENLSTQELDISGVDSSGNITGDSADTSDIGGNTARAGLADQYNELRDQLDKLADDASFNGVNLLRGDNLKITFNETGTSSLDIQTENGESIDVRSLGLELDSATGRLNMKETDLDSDAKIDDFLTQVKAAIGEVRSQASSFGSSLSIVENRQDFTKNMINTLETGAGNLTLADSNEEAANLLALQTRQQLSSTALSMASQADQAVLRLF